MKTKYLALAAGLLTATPSLAQITAVYSGANPNVLTANPVAAGAYGTVKYQNNFNTAADVTSAAAVFSPALNFATGNSSTSGYYSAPAGDSSQYAYIAPYTQAGVPASANSPVTLNTTGFGSFNTVSFLWGSMDYFNTVKFFSGSTQIGDTFTGTIPNGTAADDGQITRYVTFTIAASAVGSITSIQFASNNLAAFEIDNFALGTAAVPEAATWAMMMVGLGIAGGSLRRRKAKVSVSYAAA